MFIDNQMEVDCYHCGQACSNDVIKLENKNFCCLGCKTVYEILNQNQLCTYYSIESNPGIKPQEINKNKFNYLDDPKIIKELLSSEIDNIAMVNFYIPIIHCSSCIWLLENLFKVNAAILSSKVDFLKKEVTVQFKSDTITLKEVVTILSSLGYEPSINLSSVDKKNIVTNKETYYKLGIAGFCFGNIMLFSFPEYLSIDNQFYKNLFAYLNLLLSIPVLLYSARGYLTSAYKGLKYRFFNIDLPLSIGILALFFRSAYEVISGAGAGFFDSFSGLIFFLLIGKAFQERTYKMLNFDRDYRSYFPLSVVVVKNNKETSIPVSNIRIGDRLLIHNSELIPVDSILINGNGVIDYSFVTGESKLNKLASGSLIYAGGKHFGSIIEVEAIKEVSQSYLTQLWNNDNFNKKKEDKLISFTNFVSKYFTLAILIIGFLAFFLTLSNGLGYSVNVLTAVLIVACPCALALSIPFTFGNILRIMSNNKFYLKNITIIQELAKINHIIFDKTGTITSNNKSVIQYFGDKLNQYENKLVFSTASASTHPLSKLIVSNMSQTEYINPKNYMEYEGQGVISEIEDNYIKLGSSKFVSGIHNNDSGSKVFLSINDCSKGYFLIKPEYRTGLNMFICELKKDYSLSLLSGDNNSEKNFLSKIFPNESNLLFNQSPFDKLNYIQKLKAKGQKILMVGDGLNDAGALNNSDVGIAVSDDVHSFSPACDAIIDSNVLYRLSDFLKFSKTGLNIIYLSFFISFLYNIVGLFFAVQGLLVPLVAAILMPLSSISVIAFASLSVKYAAKRYNLE